MRLTLAQAQEFAGKHLTHYPNLDDATVGLYTTARDIMWKVERDGFFINDPAAGIIAESYNNALGALLTYGIIASEDGTKARYARPLI